MSNSYTYIHTHPSASYVYHTDVKVTAGTASKKQEQTLNTENLMLRDLDSTWFKILRIATTSKLT